VPRGNRFTTLGEGIAFDGRFVGFWGAWGEKTRPVKLYCSEEGNKDRIAYCSQAPYCTSTPTQPCQALDPEAPPDSIVTKIGAERG
jgi:hypothetical protein